MCGLVGAVDFSNKALGLRITQPYLTKLIQSNIHRGGSQYGIAIQPNYQGNMNAMQHNWKPDASEVARFLTSKSSLAFMFHTRAATANNLNKTLDHVQPFYTDKPDDAIPYAFMQNAILHGWEDNARHLGVETDSQVINEAFKTFYATRRLEDSLYRVTNAYKGQQASALYLSGSRTLYLWRVMNPLYLNWIDPDTLIFASTPLSTGSWELIPEGQVIKIQPKSKVLSHFTFDSIYGDATS